MDSVKKITYEMTGVAALMTIVAMIYDFGWTVIPYIFILLICIGMCVCAGNPMNKKGCER